jgi:fermentation-respiration switch protein FrsA (DUF1100 family)
VRARRIATGLAVACISVLALLYATGWTLSRAEPSAIGPAPASLDAELRPQIGIGADDLRPVDHIASLNCPILMIGGTVDRHTTLADTELLFAAAREPKELWLVPNAAHVDFLRFAGDEYRRRVLVFLAAAFAQGLR